eukprot:7288043-Pyramimonas_sp.AAC.1
MIDADFLAKINKIVRDRQSSSQLRHLASEIERLDISSRAARNVMTCRGILRIIAVRVIIRQGRGQACACADLMEIRIRGAGKGAVAIYSTCMMSG